MLAFLSPITLSLLHDIEEHVRKCSKQAGTHSQFYYITTIFLSACSHWLSLSSQTPEANHKGVISRHHLGRAALGQSWSSMPTKRKATREQIEKRNVHVAKCSCWWSRFKPTVLTPLILLLAVAQIRQCIPPFTHLLTARAFLAFIILWLQKPSSFLRKVCWNKAHCLGWGIISCIVLLASRGLRPLQSAWPVNVPAHIYFCAQCLFLTQKTHTWASLVNSPLQHSRFVMLQIVVQESVQGIRTCAHIFSIFCYINLLLPVVGPRPTLALKVKFCSLSLQCARILGIHDATPLERLVNFVNWSSHLFLH